MKHSVIEPKDVEVIPDFLEEGSLYICERYRIAAHKCCCGCGQEVITPLNTAEWSLMRRGPAVSLLPSIGNWSFPCRSHYWIKSNQVIWSVGFTEKEIKAVKERDRAAKIAYVDEVNQKKAEQHASSGFFGRCRDSFRRWLGL